MRTKINQLKPTQTDTDVRIRRKEHYIVITITIDHMFKN